MGAGGMQDNAIQSWVFGPQSFWIVRLRVADMLSLSVQFGFLLAIFGAMFIASDSTPGRWFAGVAVAGYSLCCVGLLVPAVSVNGWLMILGQGTLTRVQRVSAEDLGGTLHASVFTAKGDVLERRIVGRMCVFRE